MTTIKLKFIPPIVAGINIFVLLGCIIGYFLFNVEVDGLPPLSLTGIYPPTKYLFQGSMIIVGLVLMVGAFVIQSVGSYQIRSMVRQQNQTPVKCCFCVPLEWGHFVRSIFLGISGLGLFGLALVPIFETDTHGNDWQAWNISTVVHLGFTFVFFLTSLIHMIVGTIVTFAIQKQMREKKIWFVVKLVSVIITLVAWPILPMLLGFFVSVACGTPIQSCFLFKAERVALNALNQYLAILGIMIYLITLMYELKHSSITINGDHDLELFSQMNMNSIDHTEDAFDLDVNDESTSEDEKVDTLPQQSMTSATEDEKADQIEEQ